MANSKLERKYQQRFGDELFEQHGIWSYIIPDTPTLSPHGFVRSTNEFDTIVCCKGVAIEFKYKRGGLSFNIRKWMEDEDTEHQYKDLKAFAESKSGNSVLVIAWIPNGKRDVQYRWAYHHEILDLAEGDLLYMRDMKEKEELIEMIRGLNK